VNGRLALVGGDEFRSGCESMDAAILAATGKSRPVVLIVPTAAAFENPARAADNGVRHFQALGADASPLMVLDHDDASDAGIAAEVESADVVYLTGGNPAHLLDSLRNSLLLDSIQTMLERGGTLAGSSAGAMVMGSWMRFREWRRTLGIAAGIATLPHHERADPDTVVEELRTAPDDLSAVFGVDGRAGALSGPDGWTALGTGRVTVYHSLPRTRYGDGGWRRFEDGQSFSVD
jgi:cyanophycinase